MGEFWPRKKLCVAEDGCCLGPRSSNPSAAATSTCLPWCPQAPGVAVSASPAPESESGLGAWHLAWQVSSSGERGNRAQGLRPRNGGFFLHYHFDLWSGTRSLVGVVR